MGNYTKKLSERFSTRGPNSGFCAICRTHDTLTKDHVPPKGCGNVSDVVIRDVYGSNLSQQRKALTSQGGLHFKTICGRCNNTLLGAEYDPALSAVVQEIESYLVRASASRLTLPKMQLFEYQQNRFLRSVLGHLLAANAVNDVTKNSPVAPLDAALRSYLLDSSAVLPESIHVYYWLYPYRRRVIMKHCAMSFMGAGGDVIYGHVFKFFPFGFWVVWNEKKINKWNINLQRLGLDSSPHISATSRLALDFLPLQAPDFPETPPDNGMWLLVDHLVLQAETKA